MKKSFLVTVLAVFACFAAIALDAKVVSITGKVEVQNGDSWVAVKVGDTLKKGDVVSTGFKSGAVLQINETNVTVGALTRMTVQQLASDDVKDETSLFVDSGKISANVQHNEKRVSFKVTTPVVTASVRGTILTTLYDTVGSDQNTVIVTPSDQSEAIIAAETVPAATTNRGVPTFEGTPVMAGQTTTADPISGIAAAPQETSRKNTQTVSLGAVSNQEGEKSSVAGITSDATPVPETSAETSVNISIEW